MSHLSPRNFGCRLTEVVLQGLRTLYLENEVVRVGILVDKGTDIFEFLHKPTDTDFLFRSPSGIRNPATFIPTRPSSGGNFLDYWPGGWPEMFPNAGYVCTYKGAELGTHGDVSLLPWEWRVVDDDPEEVVIALEVRCYRLPLRLEKWLTLRRGSGVLAITERATNESGETIDFSWGHHPTFGGIFLGPACVVDVPPCRVLTAEWDVDQTSRLANGVNATWPVVPGRDGRLIDLSQAAPPETGAHDLAFLHELPEGWYAITNAERGAGFGMRWDTRVFRWLWFWQNWRGMSGWPSFRQWYTCALEPASSYPPTLTDAIARGTQLTLAPGQSLETDLLAVAYSGAERVTRITPDGQVLRRGA
ncbi:MAG: DUF4432 family protein [Chloroflexi bacterium]|nr:DUF4432 family protein [Chloroflexota bacterium]